MESLLLKFRLCNLRCKPLVHQHGALQGDDDFAVLVEDRHDQPQKMFDAKTPRKIDF